ncbi:ATP-binding protein, partial [Streptomyces sp. NPDC046727]|uniref:ATP-binding protein n=1 Tax=Streptomyces sp. NPDC046727 TaxID=3155373 RepID=UPI0033C770AB
PPQRGPRRRPPADADDFELLAADLARAHDGAVTAVVRAAQLSSQTGSEQKLEVFVNLARRLQSLVHREISILDDLENEIEDPDLLKGLFHVDHLATRIRRHAENLAVLGGAVSRRQWSNPVSMTEVLRSAIAEVEQYSRVKLVPPIDGELRGHAVADVIHLLAELIENATVFSAPQTQVLLRANLVTSGLAVEVEDRGLGMPVGEQSRMNALLADPDQVNVASLLADGRIGLYVVSQLARRHGIHVRLQTNIYGGVQAVLVVPQALLGNAPGVPGAGAAAHGGAGGAGSAASGAALSGAGSAATEVGAGAGQAPATGRRRHAQRGSGRRGAESGGAGRAGTDSGPGRRGTESGVPGRHGSAPAPLPVRGAHEARPTPAEAVPGISAGDRPVVEAHEGILPTPRAATGPGTVDKPRLPRRRAQEHIVPQLRGGPAPRQDADTVAGHDPGLMAAFQRGIGLAEAQQSLEPEYEEPGAGASAYGATGFGESSYGHMGSAHTDAPHMAGTHLPASGRTPVPEPAEPTRPRPEPGAPEHIGAQHNGAASHIGTDHHGSHTMGPDTMGSPYTGPAHMDAHHMGPDHTVPNPKGGPDHTVPNHTMPNPVGPDPTLPVHMASNHMAPDHTAETHMATPPIPQAHAHTPVSDGIRGTGRTEGSTPAG